MAIVETRDIRKHFGEIRTGDGVSIATRDGEFLVLLGTLAFPLKAQGFPGGDTPSSRTRGASR